MSKETLTLRLAGLPLGHSVHEGALEFAVLDAAECEEPCRLRVRCDVDNLGTRLHVRGGATGSARSTCHRCLVAFERRVEAGFDLTVEKGLLGAAGDEIVGVTEHAVEFDLSPYVREAVILEEPIQLLCTPACRGLCPQCGADLNQGACGCAPALDERWSLLRDRIRPPEF